MNSNTGIHQCWPIRWMQSIEPAWNDGRWEHIPRESQGTLCYQHAMVMIMVLYIYKYTKLKIYKVFSG